MITSKGAAPKPGAALIRWLKIVRRRWLVLIVPTLCGAVIGVIGFENAPRRYVSEAVLALDARRFQGLPSESVISPLPQESPVLRTELDIIGSRTMAEFVMRRLEARGVDLSAEPRVRHGLLAGLTDIFATSAPADGAASEASDNAAKPDPLPAAIRDRQIVDKLLDGLRVINDARSYTIFISYTAADPDRAAAIANAFANAYIDHQVEIQTSATTTVSRWLGERVVSLRSDLEAAERAREDYVQKAGLVKFDGTTLQAQRVAALNAELISIQNAREATEARLTTARRLAASKDGLVLTEILSSPTIQALRVEQASVQRQIEAIEGGGAMKSAQLPLLKSQSTALSAQINGEVQRVIESLANEIAVFEAKEQTIRKTLDDAKAALSRTDHALVKLAELDREVTASNAIYESYLTRYKQTVEQDGIANPEARLISAAEPAGRPASPRLSVWLMFGLMAGGLAGLAGLVLRELTDRRIRSSEDLEEAGGIPVLGLVQGDPQPGPSPISIRRHATFARAIAALHAVLRSGAATRKAKIMAIASPRRSRDRTAILAALARSLAASGNRVLLVDTDLRWKHLTETLAPKATAFLDEALQATRSLDDLVQTGVDAGLDLVAGRPGDVPPEVLFDTGRFEAMLERFAARYDIILIDTPPILETPSSMQVVIHAEEVLLVVDRARSGLDTAMQAIEVLQAAGKPPAGLILSEPLRYAAPDQAMRRPPAAPPANSHGPSAPAGGPSAPGDRQTLPQQGRPGLRPAARTAPAGL